MINYNNYIIVLNIVHSLDILRAMARVRFHCFILCIALEVAALTERVQVMLVSASFCTFPMTTSLDFGSVLSSVVGSFCSLSGTSKGYNLSTGLVLV